MTTPRPIIMAPGIYFQEVDLSQYVRELTNSKLALIGPAQKGEVNKNLLLTSLSNAVQELGIPREDDPALLVLREYFNAGGGRVNYCRVANGDLSATATVDTIDGEEEEVAVPSSGGWYNNQKLKISYGAQAATVHATQTHTFAVGTGTYTLTMANVPIVAGTLVIKFGSTKIAEDDGAGALVFESSLAEFAKYSGTINYLTGDLSITTTSLTSAVTGAQVNVSYNNWTTFNVQVQYTVKDSAGNTINAPYTMESHKSLTLATMVDRLAVSKYLDIETAWGAFPVAGTYSFSGGDDGRDDLLDSDYIGNTLVPGSPTGLQVFAFPDQIDINLVAIPGASRNLAVRQALTQFTEVSRADTLAILDPPPSLSVQDVADWANGNGDYNTYDTLDTTYSAIYYPWYTSYNNLTNENEQTPPSAAAAAAFARSNAWEAPAGPNRGKLLNIIDIDQHLNPNDRAFLAENRVNPISDLNGIGMMVLGQQTATLQASSLDRVAARMMLMRIEKAVTTALYPLIFEPNTPRTWNRATMIIQPYLESLVKLERIYNGEFICDRTTNTDQIINNNIMAATCRLTLLKYAEIIVVTFLLTALGAEITESRTNAQTNV